MEEQRILLEVKNVSKSFANNIVLNNVSFNLKKGEVLGLVGENGAGKSTLVNILGGIHRKNTGQTIIDGLEIDIKNPITSKKEGINIVHQEITILDHLSVAENVLIDDFPKLKNFPIVNWPKAYKLAKNILDKLKVEINPKSIAGNLTVANKRIIEIARVIHSKGKIIILDEPTAALTRNDVNNLFKVIKELKKEEISIIFISHLLDEILEICDRVIVLRDGKLVCNESCKNLERKSIIKHMVGREIEDQYPKISSTIGKEVLKIENLNLKNTLKDISFNLNEREILAFYGLMGSGCSELVRTIFGIYLPEKANIILNNRNVKIKSPIDAIKNSIGYISADRKFEGILSALDVQTNINVASLDLSPKKFLIDNKYLKKNALYWVNKIKIKIDNVKQKIQNLSGGNQQKVIVGRWLNSRSKILIFDEPTKGIDVGAKTEIYKIMEEICQSGSSIIMISSDIDEIIGIADRALVFTRGRISKELSRKEITKENLLYFASKI